MRMQRRQFVLGALGAAAAGMSPLARAAAYPERPVTSSAHGRPEALPT